MEGTIYKDNPEFIYGEMYISKASVTANYKVYYRDIAFMDPNQSLTHATILRVHDISYNPDRINQASTCIINFTVNGAELHYLMAEFPQDIWFKDFSATDKTLSAKIEYRNAERVWTLLTLDPTTPYYTESNKMVVQLENTLKSDFEHRVTISNLPMPETRVKVLRNNIFLTGGTKTVQGQRTSYRGVSHPDLYDFPVTPVKLPAGM